MTSSHQPIHFRFARHEDIPALVKLVTSAYRGDASRQGWTTEADLLDGMRIDAERLKDAIDTDHSVILVAEEHSQILACAHLCIDNDAGYFGMFAVDPMQQSRGLGKRVLQEAEQVLDKQWKQPACRMTVIDVRDELIAFYERCGYARTGIKKPFPYGDERFGIPKTDNLQFEILEKTFS